MIKTINWSALKQETNISMIKVYSDHAIITIDNIDHKLETTNFQQEYDELVQENKTLEKVPISFLKKRNRYKWATGASIGIASIGIATIAFGYFMYQKNNNGFNKISKKLNSEFNSVSKITGMIEKKDILNIIENEEKILQLGGYLPKGYILTGKPGTGKTLLAKTLAKETNKNFFHVNASEFNKHLVGKGAEHIRNLVKKAQKKGPSVIFIDEIDAIAKSRSNSSHGSQNERESTLNQLLTEMDGFNSPENVTFIAATNRPELIDKALLRPGRFDRIINVELPQENARKEILNNYLKKIKLSSDLHTLKENLALKTKNFTPAEIKNLTNEAVIDAAIKEQHFVNEGNFNNAINYIKKNRPKKISWRTKIKNLFIS